MNDDKQFEGFTISPMNNKGLSDITCHKCGVVLKTLTKHFDIVETLRCGNCGFVSKKFTVVSKEKSVSKHRKRIK